MSQILQTRSGTTFASPWMTVGIVDASIVQSLVKFGRFVRFFNNILVHGHCGHFLRRIVLQWMVRFVIISKIDHRWSGETQCSQAKEEFASFKKRHLVRNHFARPNISQQLIAARLSNEGLVISVDRNLNGTERSIGRRTRSLSYL